MLRGKLERARASLVHIVILIVGEPSREMYLSEFSLSSRGIFVVE